MVYQEKETMFEKKPSEAIYHTHQHTAKKMTGLEQKREDATKEKSMREIFHMENAFGDISLGVNEQKEFAFVIDRKKYWNGPIASREEKVLNRQRSSAWNNRLGYTELNRGKRQNSAYAFILNKGWAPEKKVLQETDVFGKKMQQQTISTMLPFSMCERKTTEDNTLMQKLSREIGWAMKREKKKPDLVNEIKKGEFRHPVVQRQKTESGEDISDSDSIL